MALVDWIAVDWGTSRLRAYLMSAADEVIVARASEQGMGSLEPGQFEAALLALVGDVLPAQGRMKVVCCGMVGAAQGWMEAAYARAPCPPPGPAEAVRPPVRDRRLDVIILPGVCQLEPPDVMRGEETQIRGFLANHAGYAGSLCLPGTHTKWVAIAHDRITRFQTCMTGELFGLLAKQSVLRHSLGTDELDMTAFARAIEAAADEPAMLPTELFRIRASGLVGQADAAAARGRLSGLLIGAELMAARDYWLHTAVRLIGDERLSVLYREALRVLGSDAIIVDATDLTLRGLIAAHKEHRP